MADRGYRYSYRDHEAQRDEGLPWLSAALADGDGYGVLGVRP
jgi:hypothetical protein